MFPWGKLRDPQPETINLVAINIGISLLVAVKIFTKLFRSFYLGGRFLQPAAVSILTRSHPRRIASLAKKQAAALGRNSIPQVWDTYPVPVTHVPVTHVPLPLPS